MTDDSSGRRRSKVERVIDTYDLEGWGDRLEAEWIGDGAERTSLRDLATEFNQAVLRSALRDAGASVLNSDIEALYRTLTDDDVPRSETVRKRRELERSGVDIDDVRSDFLTHQTVYTYLTNVRDASLPDEDSGDRVDRKKETIQRLTGRTQVVTESTLDELGNAGEIADRNYDVFVDVRAICGNCGADYSVTELLERGGCDCDVTSVE
ncbi:rod-determining factor RdfA [Natrinema caseinilyticum]|uniref:rod-determining factor RdfA n=1 Tax=Natrinema caseinilyticum TaxID=2961570 RepID=UPI0020C2C430|nr:rod-determining factor RdfA [Natrinema caseinilyticum]